MFLKNLNDMKSNKEIQRLKYFFINIIISTDYLMSFQDKLFHDISSSIAESLSENMRFL